MRECVQYVNLAVSVFKFMLRQKRESDGYLHSTTAICSNEKKIAKCIVKSFQNGVLKLLNLYVSLGIPTRVIFSIANKLIRVNYINMKKIQIN